MFRKTWLQSGYIVSKASENTKQNRAHGISIPNAGGVMPRLYDLNTAARYLGRSTYSLRTLIWNGELPVVKSGKKMWCDIMDLNAWIDRNKQTMMG